MFKSGLKKLDNWLLPRKLDQQLMPYVWLIYLPFFFVPVFFWSQQVSHWLYTILATFAFLALYFRTYWVSRRRMLKYIILTGVLGSICALYTPSAQTLFIYAAAFCCRLPTQKQAFIVLAAILVWMGIYSFIMNLNPGFYIPGIFFSFIIGLVNIYQFALQEKKKALILSQEEAQQLAKVAERERIARDLHDLIGHTFSVITLKADLAGRLLDKGQVKDFEKAREEIKQLESISRDALSQVREVVSGYRSSDLLSELANAKYVLSSVEIDFEYELKGIEKSELEVDIHNIKELAIVLRELVTNIIKHSKASRVNVVIERKNSQIVLNVQDDGKGFSNEEASGFGLKGIQERIAKLSGSLEIQSGPSHTGTLAIVGVPYEVAEGK